MKCDLLKQYNFVRKILAHILAGTLFIFSSWANAYTDSSNSTKQNILTKQLSAPLELVTGKNFSGNVDLTTNYIYNGISQTSNLPALQGGFAYTFLKTGIYFSIWGTNVYFIDNRGNKVTAELDPSVGITNKVGEHFSYDFNVARYIYPGANNNDYYEYSIYLVWHFITSQITYSNDDFATGKSGYYYNLGFLFDVPPKYFFNLNDINLSGGIGYSNLPDNVGLHSYKDYNVMLSKTFGRYRISLQWTDTDRNSTDTVRTSDNKILATFLVNF
jgi:uncharacterized protein (TIGR02001 family)